MTARTPRATYRHGDLRHALIEAGTDMARHGGPDAVVLREATRRVGVAPNAAYRHFADRDALLRAVAHAAMAQLADAIEHEQAAASEADDLARARARLRAVGTGYLRFAQAEPGLFRTAFVTLGDLSAAAETAAAGSGGLTPFQLLVDSLDGLVQVGALPPERRPGAEFLAWSAVHGLAMLLIAGPLSALDEDHRGRAARALLDMVERGL